MSTNYYIARPGEAFDADHSIHVGKFTNQAVSFQGHEGEFDTRLTSWAQYKQVIRIAGEVWSEYGVAVEAEDFIAQVENVTPANRGAQYDWVRTSARTDALSRLHLERCWLDEEGYSFTWADFL